MNKIAFLVASAAITTSNLSFAACPNYNALTHLPAFPSIPQDPFKHFGSRTISAWYTPYHMSHDIVVKADEPSTITGKFDYDRAIHKDLEDEKVKAFLYGEGMNQWQALGEYTTDRDGKIFVTLPKLKEGEYAVHMIVEGDLSSTTGYVSVINNKRDAVLFDIDGTLTLNDFEAVGDYLGISNAQAYGYAKQTVKAYQEKGYQILYLSARPYWLMKNSRAWLRSQDLLPWHVHSNANAELLEHKDTADYKQKYIKQLQANGIHIFRAYGNANTDIQAYAEAGIPKTSTYIIGENAGKDGTQAISGDYSYHYSTLVMNTPSASCG